MSSKKWHADGVVCDLPLNRRIDVRSDSNLLLKVRTLHYSPSLLSYQQMPIRLREKEYHYRVFFKKVLHKREEKMQE